MAYETLAKADRKARHLAAAAYLERTLGEQEVVEVVASHYLDAYRVAPDAADAGEIRATAGERLAGAGVRAASLGANEEAERYFAQAAELADDPLAKATLEEQAGRIAWRGLRPVEARVYLGRALAAFEAAGLGRRSARVSATVAEIDYREGHLSEAVARLETALATLADEEPDEDLAYAAAQLGRFLVLNNQSEEGAPRLELALELAEALRLPEVFCQALTSKAISYVNQNRLEEGRILLEGALERALANDLHTAATRTINNLAVDHESADRYREAVNVTAQGLELARRVGDRLSEEDFVFGPLSSLVLLGVGRGARSCGEVWTRQGCPFAGSSFPSSSSSARAATWHEARDRLDTDVALRESEDLQEQLGYGFAEALVLRLEGRPREALAAADSALALGLELGTTFINVKLCLVEVLEAAFAVGDRGEVERRLEMIEGLRPGERPLLLEAQAHRFRSKLNGDEAGFRAAAALFRELETPFWLAVTLLEHGEAAGSAPLVDEAREIFARLEATPWLARCDALAPARAETASV